MADTLTKKPMRSPAGKERDSNRGSKRSGNHRKSAPDSLLREREPDVSGNTFLSNRGHDIARLQANSAPGPLSVAQRGLQEAVQPVLEVESTSHTPSLLDIGKGDANSHFLERDRRSTYASKTGLKRFLSQQDLRSFSFLENSPPSQPYVGIGSKSSSQRSSAPTSSYSGNSRGQSATPSVVEIGNATPRSDEPPVITIDDSNSSIDESGTSPYRKQNAANTKAEYQIPEFEPWGVKKKLVDINDDIIGHIKCGITGRTKEEAMKWKTTGDGGKTGRKKRVPSTHGYIYIYQSPCAPNHLKIGQTERPRSKRISEWKICNMPLEEVEYGFEDRFDYFFLAESLIHLELYNYRRRFTCKPCSERKATAKQKAQLKEAQKEAAADHGAPASPPRVEVRNHKEWHMVEPDLAKEVVYRWCRWMADHAPFDDRGALKPYWEWRLKKIEKQPSTVDWGQWTRPSTMDLILYYYCNVEGRCRKVAAHWARHDPWFWAFGVAATFITHSWFGRSLALFVACIVLIS